MYSNGFLTNLLGDLIQEILGYLGYALGVLSAFIWKESNMERRFKYIFFSNENKIPRDERFETESENSDQKSIFSMNDFVKIEKKNSVNANVINNENLLCPILNCN